MARDLDGALAAWREASAAWEAMLRTETASGEAWEACRDRVSAAEQDLRAALGEVVAALRALRADASPIRARLGLALDGLREVAEHEAHEATITRRHGELPAIDHDLREATAGLDHARERLDAIDGAFEEALQAFAEL